MAFGRLEDDQLSPNRGSQPQFTGYWHRFSKANTILDRLIDCGPAYWVGGGGGGRRALGRKEIGGCNYQHFSSCTLRIDEQPMRRNTTHIYNKRPSLSHWKAKGEKKEVGFHDEHENIVKSRQTSRTARYARVKIFTSRLHKSPRSFIAARKKRGFGE